MVSLLVLALNLTSSHANPTCAKKLRGPKVYERVDHKPSPRYVLTLTQNDASKRTYLELIEIGPNFFEARFLTKTLPRVDDSRVHKEAESPFNKNRAEFRVRSLLLAAGLRLFPADLPLKIGFAWDSDKLNWDDFANEPSYKTEGTWLAKFLRRRRFLQEEFDRFDFGPRVGIEEGLVEPYALSVVREKGWYAHSVFTRLAKKIDRKPDTQPTNVELR